MSPTKRWIEESDEVWNLFKSVFDPRLELGTMRIAVVKELGELSKLGVDHASTALRGVESGKYDPTIKDAVAISVSELADLIMELEAVRETGVCETCNKRDGIRRRPCIADKQEAEKMSYISCDECFEAVWAGEL